MGGEGHMMDMNKRIEQNRSLKSSQKKSKKFNIDFTAYRYFFPERINHKPISKEKLNKIKTEIRNKAKRDKRNETIISVVVSVIVITIILVLII